MWSACKQYSKPSEMINVKANTDSFIKAQQSDMSKRSRATLSMSSREDGV